MSDENKKVIIPKNTPTRQDESGNAGNNIEDTREPIQNLKDESGNAGFNIKVKRETILKKDI